MDSKPSRLLELAPRLLAVPLLVAGCSGEVGNAADTSPSSTPSVFEPGAPIDPAAPPDAALTPGGGPIAGVPGAPGASAAPGGVPAPTVDAAGNPVPVGTPTVPATEVAVESGPRPGLAARLSKVEYGYSVLDVLGVALTAEDLDPALGGIPDDAGDGVFKHFSDKQTSTEQHPLAYFEVGERVAQRVDVSALMANETACANSDVNCGRAVLASVGRRLFRRPLDAREVETFNALLDALLVEEPELTSALRYAIAAQLQSPQFLFHIEDETSGTVGEARPVTAYELAARLAAFIWVSVPDEALLAAAESGTLLDPAVLTQEVERMFVDEKAQRFTETFIGDFSRARLASFEGATDEVRNALVESVVATFQHHFWEAGRSVADLFTTTEFVLNPTVAELLGVAIEGDGLVVTDVSTLPERIGILTHPGSIAGMGDRGIGSFVNRGKYMMERLLCRNPIVLPAALLPEIEAFVSDNSGLNEHEKMEIRKTRPECWFCHTQFDPFAVGFSRFDGSGRYLGETDAAGKPLSLDGWVPTASEEDSPHYSNMSEYMQILATDPQIQTCLTEHFLAFATARATDETAKGFATTVGAEYLQNGSTLNAMVHAVSETSLFQQIRVVSPADAAAGAEL